MRIKLLLTSALCLALIGCTGEQITVTLEAAIHATEIALPLIAAAGNVSPGLVSQMENYLVAVDDAASRSTVILDDQTLTPAQRASELTALFAAASAPDLPAGTPQAVANAIAGVAHAVTQFLLQVQTVRAQVQLPRHVMAFDAKTQPAPRLSPDKLRKLRERAKAAKRKIEAAKKK